MSGENIIEQGEDPGIDPSVLSGRDNAAGVPVVGPAAVPGTNGSPERDGTRHRFAWTYGLTAKEYAGMGRRT